MRSYEYPAPIISRLFVFCSCPCVVCVSQLETPILLHISVLLFQLVLVSLIAFISAWMCSNFLLSTMTSQNTRASDSVLSAGSTVPTVLLLLAMSLIRIACYALRITPSHTLLLSHWSFPFSTRIFDSVYYGLIALAIWAAISSTISIRRIELLEVLREQEQMAARKKYALAKAEWDAQQLQHAQQIAQAREIIAASKHNSKENSPTKSTDAPLTTAAAATAAPTAPSPKAKQ
jgi:hypothetical protein